MSDTDYSYLSVRDLGEGVRRRQFRPTVLAEHFLARLERLGPRYNAVVTVMRERAMAEAQAAERDMETKRWRGPLHGVPYGVKDLLATRDAPTTWGAAPYREQKFDHDGTVVERLHEAGAVLVAKLAMVELAGGMGYNHANASFTGPGLNPWNTKFWSGGSSSGPGSAVAAGLVPFAIGSETSGSILTPSTYCGVTGLRPTYGRVSRYGAMALCWTLDKLGPMTRSAEDASLVMEVIAGRDERDATSVDHPYRHDEATLAGWRPVIAVPKGVNDKEQPAVRENFRASLDVLRRFADVETDVEWPDFPWGPAVSAIVGAEGASAFRDLIERGGTEQLQCEASRARGYAGMFVFAVDYLHAMRLRAPMKRAVAKLFERYDAVVSPGRASVAIPADLEFEKAYPGISGGPALIPAGNLCGLPALCMPNGFGENGLPTALALMGPAFSEERLVAIGREYQRITPHHEQRPNIA